MALAEEVSAPTILHSRAGVVARLAPTTSLLDAAGVESLSVALQDCYAAGETHVVIDVTAARLEWKYENGEWNENEADVQDCTVNSAEEPVACVSLPDIKYSKVVPSSPGLGKIV